MMCTAGVALFSNICNGSSVLLEGWEFSRDGKDWERVRIPHDWAITGEFNRTNDLQHVMIVQDGECVARDHTGRTGGLPWVGEGWYRRLVSLPEYAKEAELVFDGAMSNLHIKKGDAIAQVMFTKFLICDGDNASGERAGGFGSTDKK